VTDIQEYLPDKEDILLHAKGNIVTEENQNSNPYSDDEGNDVFVATDRRVAYLMNDNEFKDVDYAHISSVETELDKRIKPNMNLTGLAASVSFGIGGLLLITGNPVGIAPLILSVYLFIKTYSQLGDMEEAGDLHEEVEIIRLITGDEPNQQLEFRTSEDIGSEVSRTVRKMQSDK